MGIATKSLTETYVDQIGYGSAWLCIQNGPFEADLDDAQLEHYARPHQNGLTKEVVSELTVAFSVHQNRFILQTESNVNYEPVESKHLV